jgi:pimeloyl-ACP methyl ester carboxylesterase
VDSLAFERLVLLGLHGAAAVSIAYAVRHPQRVSKLVLCGGYAQGHNRRGPARDAEEGERQALFNAMGSLWDPKNTVFMRAFTSLWLPSGTPEQVRWFMDLARVSHSREDMAKFGAALGNIDVVDLLSKVETPTIVFHSIHDHHIPFYQGRRLACSIRNARFVALDSENHALLADEPAWAKFVSEMKHSWQTVAEPPCRHVDRLVPDAGRLDDRPAPFDVRVLRRCFDHHLGA